MPAAKPGEIWRVDLGMAAKVRPCLVLTRQPKGDELDVFTIVAHTTSLRGNHWEVPIPKPALALHTMTAAAPPVTQRIHAKSNGRAHPKLKSLPNLSAYYIPFNNRVASCVCVSNACSMSTTC